MKAWAALLRTSNLLSEISGTLLFLSQPEANAQDFSALVGLTGPKRASSSPWDGVIQEVSDAFRPVVQSLSEEELPLPVVGIELPDARGRAGEVIAELVWDTLHICVVEDAYRAQAEAQSAPGWLLFTLGELTTSLAPLIAALRERGGIAA